ncbi:MAG TPA: membrane protein insertase YidC, partial [Aestuariivirga sp.]|nr:membrane protein insertase YidC [Aestuariivirga sp.]
MQQQNTPDTKNLLLAIALSIVIIYGWQFLYAKQKPAAPLPQETSQTATQPGAAPQAAPGQATVPGMETAKLATRTEAVAASPRLAIDTPLLSGSINLLGAQLDDLHLKAYHETVDPQSPIITLLSPSGTANAYFVEQGLVAPAG